MLDHITYAFGPEKWNRVHRMDATSLSVVATTPRVMAFAVADGVTHCAGGAMASRLAVDWLLPNIAVEIAAAYQRLGSYQLQERLNTFEGVYEGLLEPCFIGNRPILDAKGYREADEKLKQMDYFFPSMRPNARGHFEDREIPPQTTFTCFYLIEEENSRIVGYFGVGDSPILVRSRTQKQIIFDDMNSVQNITGLECGLDIDQGHMGLFYLGERVYQWKMESSYTDPGKVLWRAAGLSTQTGKLLKSKRQLRAGVCQIPKDEELDALLMTDDGFSQAYGRYLRTASLERPFAERIATLARKVEEDSTAALERIFSEETDNHHCEYKHTFGQDDITLVGVSYRPG